VCISATKSGECDSETHKNNGKNNIKYNTDDDVIVSMELHTPNDT
jgi:hypothetical protein